MAIVNQDGFVENVVIIGDDSDWPTPDGCYLVDAETSGSPGDTWDGKTFIRPDRKDPEPTELDLLKAEIEILKTKITALEKRGN